MLSLSVWIIYRKVVILKEVCNIPYGNESLDVLAYLQCLMFPDISVHNVSVYRLLSVSLIFLGLCLCLHEFHSNKSLFTLSCNSQTPTRCICSIILFSLTLALDWHPGKQTKFLYLRYALYHFVTIRAFEVDLMSHDTLGNEIVVLFNDDDVS